MKDLCMTIRLNKNNSLGLGFEIEVWDASSKNMDSIFSPASEFFYGYKKQEAIEKYCNNHNLDIDDLTIFDETNGFDFEDDEDED